MSPAAQALLEELRTPLTVVLGFLEVAAGEDDDAALRGHVAVAERNAQALRAAIEALDAELRAGR
jgi:signal transduction histidine kinase